MRYRTIGAAILTIGLSFPVYGQMRGADDKPMFPPIPERDEYANEVKQCGKRWNAKYWIGLTKDQKIYMLSTTSFYHDKADVDKDGKPDVLTMQSRPMVEPCEMKYEWYDKQNTVTFDYGNGRVWEYQDLGELVEGIQIFPQAQQVRIYGKKHTGDGWEKYIKFTIPEEKNESSK